MCFLLLIYVLQPLYRYSFKAYKLSQWKVLNVKGRLSLFINVELFTKLGDSHLFDGKNLIQVKAILKNFLNSFDIICCYV